MTYRTAWQRHEFRGGCFLGVLPSDLNRTLYVGGQEGTWDGKAVTELLLSTLEGVKR